MIKVAHIVDLPGPNPWINGVLEHHDRTRFCHLVVSLGPWTSLHEAVEARGGAAFALGARSRADYHRAITTLVRILRRERVDIAQTHTFEPGTVGLAAAVAARTPVRLLTRHHADFTTLFNKPIHRQLDRLHAHVADAIWAPSNLIKKSMTDLEHVPGDKITVLSNAFDFDVIRPHLYHDRRRALRQELGGDGRLLIATVARLAVEKCYPYLLEAIPQVISEVPEALFLIVGSGPLRSELESRIADLGLGRHVRMLGWRADVWSVMEAVDVVVHPTPREPFGLVLVEAMAMERAVVAAGDSGACEIIVDRETGLLVAPRSPEALARAIVESSMDPEWRAALGQRARASVVTRFSFKMLLPRYERFYTELHVAADRGR